jgi:MoxR-like ATPase
MADFRLQREDFERYVTKKEHGGVHLWDVLLPHLERVYSIPFESQLFNRFDPLKDLWFWPRTARWYQTRLVFRRPDPPERCFVGLYLERASREELVDKGVTDPDWPRLERAIRSDANFRQTLERLFESGFEAHVHPWGVAGEGPYVARALDELDKILTDTERAEGLGFLVLYPLDRDEVLAADNQIELFMRHYRAVKPIFDRLVPDWIKTGDAPPPRPRRSPMQQIAERVTGLLEHNPQIILQGAPGTGKTYTALLVTARKLQIEEQSPGGLREALHPYQLSSLLETDAHLRETPDAIAEQVRERGHGLWDIVQLHPSYSYEDFVRGVVAEPAADGHSITFRAVNRVFGLMAAIATELARDESPLPVVLIVDEINRGDLSKVLGELIYALEYRDETVLTPYAVNGQPGLTVPRKNFFLIGTMNTADRSIALVDYAIRRRFTFIQLNPSEEVIAGFYEDKPLGVKALALFKEVQKQVRAQLTLAYNEEDMAVGHTYFLADSPEELAAKLAFGVAPLLREYAKEGIIEGDVKLDLEDRSLNLNHDDQFELMHLLEDWIRSDE